MTTTSTLVRTLHPRSLVLLGLAYMASTAACDQEVFDEARCWMR